METYTCMKYMEFKVVKNFQCIGHLITAMPRCWGGGGGGGGGGEGHLALFRYIPP